MGEKTQTLADVQVEELAISAAAAATLRAAGYGNLEVLAMADPATLGQIKGVGPKTVAAVLAAVAEFAPDEEATEPDANGDATPSPAVAADLQPASTTSAAATVTVKMDGARPVAVPVRPKPRPDPRPRIDPAASRPRGCLWIRLRKGTRQITCEARIPALRQTVTIRLLEGYRYPMPPDVELGDVREWHRMIVKEAVQTDYEAVTLADLAVERWKVSRANVAHFLSQAQAIIERYQGKTMFAELMMAKDGAKQVHDRYVALRAAHPEAGLPTPVEIHLQQNPPMPAGVVPIPAEENLVAKDRLAFGRTGQQYANERDLARAAAEESKAHEVPDWMQNLMRQQLEQAIATAPNALL